MIEFRALEKAYGSFQAVHPLSFEIKKGEIFGFLGPNGAGKTTTIRMMMGLLVPTRGSVLIDSFDSQECPVEIKRRVGYLPDNPIFYDYLRGHELLSFVAEMHGLTRPEARARAAKMLKEFDLFDAGNEFAINYSMGMKKRLGLAMAMMHEPAVLILDEPINGLDPRAAHQVQNKLLQGRDQGRTILLSTHLLGMAEKICDRVAIIDQGKIRAIDTVENLRQGLTLGGSLEDVFLKFTDPSGHATS